MRHSIASARWSGWSMAACFGLAMACHGPEAPPPRSPVQQPVRYAWDGFSCVAFYGWSTARHTFPFKRTCTEVMVPSCASRPAPPSRGAASGDTAELDITIDAMLIRGDLALEPENGFIPVAFWVEEPLSEEQREALRCCGVILWEDYGRTLLYGAVSRKGLAAFVRLPFVQRVESGEARDHTT